MYRRRGEEEKMRKKRKKRNEKERVRAKGDRGEANIFHFMKKKKLCSLFFADRGQRE